MPRLCSTTCCRSVALLALVLLTVGSFSLANAQAWNGSGPFPPDADSRTVHALAIDPAVGTVYAGTFALLLRRATSVEHTR